MAILQTILFPIIFVLRWLLEIAHDVLNSYGPAIIALSVIVTLATYPIARYATKLQRRENELQSRLAPHILEAKRKYKGEEQFLEIEKIYNEFHYHPIMSIRSVAGLALQIPFLLSALFLLLSHPPLEGASFGPIADLSRPDALIQLATGFGFIPNHINLLPVIMAGLSATEAFVSPDVTPENAPRALVVTGVILVLVYTLPSSVALYWTFNNLWSLSRAAYFRFR